MSTLNRRDPRLWGVMGVVAVVALFFAGARPPAEGLSEERLYAIATQIKCLQCAGESVAGSQATIAQDFREEIRRQMAQGSTDDEILTYFVARYGQDVVLNPPATGFGALVWVVPIVGLAAALGGLGLVFARWRRERDEEARSASEEDHAMVAAALAERHRGDRTDRP